MYLCLNMLNNQIVIMKVVKRSKERKLDSDEPTDKVSKSDKLVT